MGRARRYSSRPNRSVAHRPGWLGEGHPHRLGVPDKLDLGAGLFGVTQPEPHHVLLVKRDQGCCRKGSLHGGGVPDRGDHIGRAVGAAIEQQRVSDAAGRRGADDPLVLHLDAFGARAPQRVEDRLDVLLVYHQVIGRCVAWKPALGVALSVVERDEQPRAAYRVQAGVGGQAVRCAG